MASPSRHDGTVISVKVAIALSVFVGSATPSFAADPRDALPLPSAQLFEQMLVMAEKGEYEKVRKGLELLRPLVAHVDQAFAISLEAEVGSAMASGQPDQVVIALQHLICFSIKGLLEESHRLAPDRPHMTVKIKYAYTEYLVLDRYMRQVDFEASKRVQNAFRSANTMAGRDLRAFLQACMEIQSHLERFCDSEGDLVRSAVGCHSPIA